MKKNSLGHRPKSAKIGQNQPFWTKYWISHISFVRTNPEKALRVWMVWSGLFQNPTHDYGVRINWSKTTLQINIFARIPVKLSSLPKEKKSLCRKSQGLSNSVVLFYAWKPHHACKLEQGFHVFVRTAVDVFNGVFRVSRNPPLPEQHVPWWSGNFGFSSQIDYRTKKGRRDECKRRAGVLIPKIRSFQQTANCKHAREQNNKITHPLGRFSELISSLFSKTRKSSNTERCVH